jgi:hypothetical protein
MTQLVLGSYLPHQAVVVVGEVWRGHLRNLPARL